MTVVWLGFATLEASQPSLAFHTPSPHSATFASNPLSLQRSGPGCSTPQTFDLTACRARSVRTASSGRKVRTAFISTFGPIWIHGGAWQIGGSSRQEYNGAKLAALGVVVVSFNYRLGVFGFLTINDDGLHGNYGLMDQRVVFHWVQRNIKAFGGDPGRVTLFGESAGAKSIGLHLLMPGPGELFHQAIMQSNSYGYRYRPSSVASWLGKALKASLDCETRGVRCMQQASAEELIEAQDALHGFPRSVGDFFTWAPVLTGGGLLSSFNLGRFFHRHDAIGQESEIVDREYEIGSKPAKLPGAEVDLQGRFPGAQDVGALGGTLGDSQGRGPVKTLTEVELKPAASLHTRLQAEPRHEPRHELRRRARTEDSLKNAWNLTVSDPLGGLASLGRANVVPVIIGTNAHEGTIFVYAISPWPLNRASYWFIVGLLFREDAPGVLRQYALKAEATALRDPTTGRPYDYRPVLADIITDYVFRCPSWRAAQLLATSSTLGTPVYVYEFSHPTRYEGFPACSGLACHTTEVPFVFNQISAIWANYSAISAELLQEQALAEAWADNELEAEADRRNIEDASASTGQAEATSAEQPSPRDELPVGVGGRKPADRGSDTRRVSKNQKEAAVVHEALAEALVRLHGESPLSSSIDAEARKKLGRRYWRKLKQMLQVDSDAMVARTMATRWAAFAKTGDPTDDWTDWPIWFDRNTVVDARAPLKGRTGRPREGSRSPYSNEFGGPEYIEFADPQVTRYVGRDCYCEFWDTVDYRH